MTLTSSADLSIDAGTGAISLTLTSIRDMEDSTNLQLEFLHPTHARRDMHVELYPGPADC